MSFVIDRCSFIVPEISFQNKLYKVCIFYITIICFQYSLYIDSSDSGKERKHLTVCYIRENKSLTHCYGSTETELI